MRCGMSRAAAGHLLSRWSRHLPAPGRGLRNQGCPAREQEWPPTSIRSSCWRRARPETGAPRYQYRLPLPRASLREGCARRTPSGGDGICVGTLGVAVGREGCAGFTVKTWFVLGVDGSLTPCAAAAHGTINTAANNNTPFIALSPERRETPRPVSGSRS
jgi:hypothetical protein